MLMAGKKADGRGCRYVVITINHSVSHKYYMSYGNNNKKRGSCGGRPRRQLDGVDEYGSSVEVSVCVGRQARRRAGLRARRPRLRRIARTRSQRHRSPRKTLMVRSGKHQISTNSCILY